MSFVDKVFLTCLTEIESCSLARHIHMNALYVSLPGKFTQQLDELSGVA